MASCRIDPFCNQSRPLLSHVRSGVRMSVISNNEVGKPTGAFVVFPLKRISAQECSVKYASLVVMLAAFYVLLVTSAPAQTKPSCTYFTVVTQDKLNNV